MTVLSACLTGGAGGVQQGMNNAMDKWTRLLVTLTTTLLLLLTVAVGVRLAMGIHHTLLLFALGALVAYALDPLAALLMRVRLKREASVATVFVLVLVVLGVAVWTLSGNVVRQVEDLQRHAPQYEQQAMARAATLDQTLAARNVHWSLTQTLQHPPKEWAAFVTHTGSEVVPFLRHLVTDVGESLIVLLIALYFLLFGAEMRTKFNALLPANLLSHADLWETDVNRILGGFVRGQLVIALLLGAAAAAGCFLIGIHPWLVIGLVVVVASLIPVFGPYIGALPAIVAALVGPTHFHNPVVAAVLVVILFVVINEGGSKVLYPKLVGAALGLHTVLVLFVLFAGLELGGIVGVLFAAPLTALAIVTIVHLYRFWQDLPDSLLANAARRESRLPETHDQINHPQPDPPAALITAAPAGE